MSRDTRSELSCLFCAARLFRLLGQVSWDTVTDTCTPEKIGEYIYETLFEAHTHMHTQAHARTHAHTHARPHTHRPARRIARARKSHTHTHTHTRARTHTHTHTHTRTHARTRTARQVLRACHARVALPAVRSGYRSYSCRNNFTVTVILTTTVVILSHCTICNCFVEVAPRPPRPAAVRQVQLRS